MTANGIRPAGLIFVLPSTLLVVCEALATVWYVDVSKPPGGDGLSWSSAFRHLYTALDAAQAGDEIWVARGTYLPLSDTGFQLKRLVPVYGGFVGTETERDQRNKDPNTNGTVLSGDIGTPGDDSDNAQHIVLIFDDLSSTPLDGFVVTLGRARFDSGGGALLWGGMVFRNCWFVDNRAYQHGGAISSFGSIGIEPVTIEDCRFTANQAGPDGAGGAIYLSFADRASISRCLFEFNIAHQRELGGRGGALEVSVGGLAVVDRCIFLLNQASRGPRSYGGAAGIGGNPVQVVRSLFLANFAEAGAGALALGGYRPAVIANCGFFGNVAGYADDIVLGQGGTVLCSEQALFVNCVFSGNRADQGSAIRAFEDVAIQSCTFANQEQNELIGDAIRSDSAVYIRNSILWDLTTLEFAFDQGGSLDAAFCNIRGGAGGLRILNTDPLFIDADGRDNVIGTPDDNLRLLAGSPCVDAGRDCAVPADFLDLDRDENTAESLAVDLDDEGRFFDDPGTPDTGCLPPPMVDMGAYERGGTGPQDCVGDFDADGHRGLGDLAVILSKLNQSSPDGCIEGDMDCDSDVDLSDLAGFLAIYNTPCP